MSIKLKNEAKIGILIVLTIGIFIWGFSFLKGANLLTPSNHYYVAYEEVGGLMESGHVMLKGYKVGHVDNISFVDDMQHLLVKLSIDRKFQLPKGTVAVIYSYDFMGTRAVELVPGFSTEKHSSGDTLISDIKPDLQEAVTRQIEPLARRAENMMISIDSVMGIFHNIMDDDFRESISESVEHFGSTIYSIDNMLKREDSHFNRILANLEMVTENLSDSNEDISIILNNFAAISDSLSKSELHTTINNLHDVLAEVSQVIDSINQGEGSLGKLISDEELYNNLESAAKNLDMLLIDIKNRPGRYVNFSVFGRRQD